MTKLEAVIERLKALPEDRREYFAHVVDDMLDEEADAPLLSAEQEAELARRLNGPDDYATDDETEAFFARHEK